MRQGRAVLGVLGGMGPRATAHFLDRFVAKSQGATDQECLSAVVSNNVAIPDRSTYLASRTNTTTTHGALPASPCKSIVEDARMLQAAGCDILAMPCNTAHQFIDNVRTQVALPFIDMRELAIRNLKQAGIRRAVLLCTEGTRHAGLYEKHAALYGVKIVYPSGKLDECIHHIIADIKRGDFKHFEELHAVVEKCIQNHNEAVVLGCTELSYAWWLHARAASDAMPASVLDAQSKSSRKTRCGEDTVDVAKVIDPLELLADESVARLRLLEAQRSKYQRSKYVCVAS